MKNRRRNKQAIPFYFFIIVLLLGCEQRERINNDLLFQHDWYYYLENENSNDFLFNGGILKPQVDEDNYSITFLNDQNQLFIKEINENDGDQNNCEVLRLSEDTLILKLNTPLVLYLNNTHLPIALDTLRFSKEAYFGVIDELDENDLYDFNYINIHYASRINNHTIEVQKDGTFLVKSIEFGVKDDVLKKGKLSNDQLLKLKRKLYIATFDRIGRERVFYQPTQSFYSEHTEKLKVNIDFFDDQLNPESLKSHLNKVKVVGGKPFLDYNLIQLSDYIDQLSTEIELKKYG
ncbi:hypothetical protein MY04_3915 [Flammeovirga sp. MY04]|uniref:hypothetical protein n=1 Tax=Flammeovirga sp. MY04 TaxID=1191459 RepID=UPI0008062925|nr:hypothetical protein [Flammeovirga sp. MY04]ANQ51259.1 hypothetical protein MY04_3915 [Flammeovirga sp. MY04]